MYTDTHTPVEQKAECLRLNHRKRYSVNYIILDSLLKPYVYELKHNEIKAKDKMEEV